MKKEQHRFSLTKIFFALFCFIIIPVFIVALYATHRIYAQVKMKY